jgi:hypothetical protein
LARPFSSPQCTPRALAHSAKCASARWFRPRRDDLTSAPVKGSADDRFHQYHESARLSALAAIGGKKPRPLRHSGKNGPYREIWIVFTDDAVALPAPVIACDRIRSYVEAFPVVQHGRKPGTPAPPQPQHCRRHKALMRHTAASCFPSGRTGTFAGLGTGA